MRIRLSPGVTKIASWPENGVRHLTVRAVSGDLWLGVSEPEITEGGLPITSADGVVKLVVETRELWARGTAEFELLQ